MTLKNITKWNHVSHTELVLFLENSQSKVGFKNAHYVIVKFTFVLINATLRFLSYFLLNSSLDIDYACFLTEDMWRALKT